MLRQRSRRLGQPRTDQNRIVCGLQSIPFNFRFRLKLRVRKFNPRRTYLKRNKVRECRDGFLAGNLKATNQKIVLQIKAAKADGQLTKEEAQEIMGGAVGMAKDLLGERGKRDTMKALGLVAEERLNKYLEHKLEAYIDDTKNP